MAKDFCVNRIAVYRPVALLKVYGNWIDFDIVDFWNSKSGDAP